MMGWRGIYGVEPVFICPRNAFWKALCEGHAGFFFSGGGGEHQGRFEVVVAADHIGFVAEVDEEFLGILARTPYFHGKFIRQFA